MLDHLIKSLAEMEKGLPRGQVTKRTLRILFRQSDTYHAESRIPDIEWGTTTLLCEGVEGDQRNGGGPRWRMIRLPRPYDEQGYEVGATSL
jgi:hypothetical protein